MKSASSSRSPRWRFAAIITFLFLMVVMAVLRRHELWRDEAQAWLIGRDSPSLSAVIHQSHYEGSPPLWQSTLWILARMTRDPAVMQKAHAALAGLFCFVLCAWGPFQKFETLLLVFGYYVSYEYAVLARNYLPGLLGLALACRSWSRCPGAPGAWGWLALAAFGSIQSLIVSFGLAAAFWLGAPKTSRETRSAFLLYGTAVLTSIACMLPAPDTFFPPAARWHWTTDLQRLRLTLTAILDSFIPWPVGELHSWESFRLHGRGGAPLWMLTAGPLILAAAFYSLRRQRHALIGFAVAAAGLLLFFQTRFIGAARHIGFLFFAFLFCAWIAAVSQDDNSDGAKRPLERDSLANWGWRAIFVAQLGAGVVGAWADWRYPFSQGRAAAESIRAQGLRDDVIAVGADSSGTTLSAYLDRPLYYPQGDRFGTFTIWDRRRIEFLEDDAFLDRAEKVAREKNRPLVVVLNHALKSETRTRHGLVDAGQFAGAIVSDEEFFLYRLPSTR